MITSRFYYGLVALLVSSQLAVCSSPINSAPASPTTPTIGPAFDFPHRTTPHSPILSSRPEHSILPPRSLTIGIRDLEHSPSSTNSSPSPSSSHGMTRSFSGDALAPWSNNNFPTSSSLQRDRYERKNYTEENRSRSNLSPMHNPLRSSRSVPSSPIHDHSIRNSLPRSRSLPQLLPRRSPHTAEHLAVITALASAINTASASLNTAASALNAPHPSWWSTTMNTVATQTVVALTAGHITGALAPITKKLSLSWHHYWATAQERADKQDALRAQLQQSCDALESNKATLQKEIAVCESTLNRLIPDAGQYELLQLRQAIENATGKERAELIAKHDQKVLQLQQDVHANNKSLSDSLLNKQRLLKTTENNVDTVRAQLTVVQSKLNHLQNKALTASCARHATHIQSATQSTATQ